MLQVRIHGRGGQGVVTAAELLSMASFLDGKFALAFPSFGSERTGAPVAAFCRISDRQLRAREPIVNPDVIIVQDSTLLHQVEVFAGLQSDGAVLINSTRTARELGIDELCSTLSEHQCCIFPATDIANKFLHRPLPNAALVAGFAALTQEVSLSSIEKAIQEKFPGSIGELNIEIAREAYDYVGSQVAV
ncbi:2-oxoacid:acceptor oxidoreductase family protein [Candidatus Nitronereus thalassa]|uniref:2-oxoacid:acceptor oxidoreductase family protein n=1 Tax=Candidatus Nitronereus thalassa TaxID=3020898 RepID=A0ABU3K910_9BACT|nr:2-oxoacid:acceptor oxidoreductase family protein [Candidatus Nitronereus thalassa]MDT7042873.1 2-oxoacid:acceptor oxidoreductase family protein [Candidatus Nitronereus thalassa]